MMAVVYNILYLLIFATVFDTTVGCDNVTPCRNGGTCVKQSDNTYACQCRPGYVGSQCNDCGYNWTSYSNKYIQYLNRQYFIDRYVASAEDCRGLCITENGCTAVWWAPPYTSGRIECHMSFSKGIIMSAANTSVSEVLVRCPESCDSTWSKSPGTDISDAAFDVVINFLSLNECQTWCLQSYGCGVVSYSPSDGECAKYAPGSNPVPSDTHDTYMLQNRCTPDRDGQWGPWINTYCSATCGNGTYSRTRSCNNPEPSGRGRGCQSGQNYYTEIFPCNELPCNDYAYVGCYAGSGGMLQANFTGDYVLCAAHCMKLRYPYAAVMNGTYCYCGDMYGSLGPSTGCNMLCKGTLNSFCGGINSTSVYRACVQDWKKYIGYGNATVGSFITLSEVLCRQRCLANPKCNAISSTFTTCNMYASVTPMRFYPFVFTVHRCDVRCGSNPCQNGASCFEAMDNGYKCKCAEGFSGMQCERDNRLCLRNQCAKYQVCVENLRTRTYVCTCPPGYTGATCNTDINECASNMCKNNGRCLDGVASFKCNCSTGYTGNLCEADINECLTRPDPCPMGTCVNTPGSFRCQCLEGFAGDRCQSRKCEYTSPRHGVTFLCDNGATCPMNKLLVEQQVCQCLPGYTGVRCEIDINECASNPCEWGTCINHVGMYECVCGPGYTGTNCNAFTACTEGVKQGERRVGQILSTTNMGWFLCRYHCACHPSVLRSGRRGTVYSMTSRNTCKCIYNPGKIVSVSECTWNCPGSPHRKCGGPTDRWTIQRLPALIGEELYLYCKMFDRVQYWDNVDNEPV